MTSAPGRRPRRDWIGGSGGKKQKRPPEPRYPIEDPDTIKTNQYGTIIDAISEGPIHGLVNGGASIYLDETPLIGTSGANFQAVTWEERNGTEDQDPIAFGAGVEDEQVVNVRVAYGRPVIRIVNNPNADWARVTMGYEGLLTRDNTTGDTHGGSIAIGISAAREFGTFGPEQVHTISGKASTRFSYSFSVQRPTVDPGPWRVQVRRITGDSQSQNVVNGTKWDSFTEIVSARLAYPFTAHVGVKIRADEFSQIPSRAYHVRGRLIRVPSNYDTENVDGLGLDAYSGDWDGTFKIAYSNNPAWIFYDLITHPRYGLGRYVSEAHVDKWALYRIGKYCDERVESGRQTPLGGPILERRFTMNLMLQVREQAYKVLADMASAFRGMAYWSSGIITFSQDAPKAAIHQFSPVNVKDGVFVRRTSSRTARHTVALVRWNNPDNYFMPEEEYVEDEAGIARYGINPLDVSAFGCTSRGQAHRLGRWLLLTERLEKETVTFQTGIEAATLRPGDLVNVVDPMRGGKRLAGRLRGGSLGHLDLDEPMTLDPGTVYEVQVLQGSTTEYFTAPSNASSLVLSSPIAVNDVTRVRVLVDLDGDGECEQEVEVREYIASSQTLQLSPLDTAGADAKWRVDYVLGVVTRTVTSDPGTSNILTVAPPFSVAPEPGQVWLLRAPNYTPKPYRVISVAQTDPHVYELVVLEYAEQKFALAETSLQLDTPPPGTSLPPSDLSVPQVGDLTITPELRTGPLGSRAFLAIHWTQPTGARIRSYAVRWRLNLGNWQSLEPSYGTNAEIADARPGAYDVEVIAISVLGQKSSAAVLRYSYDEASSVDLARVTGLQLEGRGNRTTFINRSPRFTWRWNHPDRAIPFGTEPNGANSLGTPPWFGGFVVRIVDPLTNSVLRTEPATQDAAYEYDDARNRADGGPRDTFRIEVSVRDVFGRLGPFAQLTVSNPAPPLLDGFRAVGGFRQVFVYFDPPEDEDLDDVKVWASTDPNFEPGPATLVAHGTGSPLTFSAEPATRYFVMAAASDAFSSEPDRLNLSSRLSVSTVQVGAPDVDGISVSSVVTAKAIIGDLIVGTAQIEDLAVTRIKIAGNSVTLFETATLLGDRNLFGPNGEAPQGTWVGLLTTLMATTGGPVNVAMQIYAQVADCYPNALKATSFDGSTGIGAAYGQGYGQRFPSVSYRMVRTPVDAGLHPIGPQVVIHTSPRVTISAPGYFIGGAISKLDSPGAGLFTYQTQMRWNEDAYDFGKVVFSAGWFNGQLGFRQVNSTGGTRWMSNAFKEDRLYVSDGAGGYLDAGEIHGELGGTYPGYHTDTQLLTFAFAVLPPYFAGTLDYKIVRGILTDLAFDVLAGSFQTTVEYRR